MLDRRYQTAVEAAIRLADWLGEPPGDGRARLISQITFLLLDSFYDTERSLGGGGAQPGAY